LRISDDYKTAEYNGYEYVRIDANHIDVRSMSYDIIYNVELTDEQSEYIIYVDAFLYNVILKLNISYYNGGYVSYCYVRSDMLDEFESFIAGDDAKSVYTINHWTYDICATADELFSNPIQMKGYEVNYYAFFDEVYQQSSDGLFTKWSGSIIADGEGNYYYVDYYQFGADNAYQFTPEDHETVTVYKITDPTVISALNGDTGNSSTDYDDAVMTTIVTGAILALFLCLIPLAAFILCLVFSARARMPYRKLLRVIACLLAVEIIAFVSIFVWVILLI
jgi:hypothetical protein